MVHQIAGDDCGRDGESKWAVYLKFKSDAAGEGEENEALIVDIHLEIDTRAATNGQYDLRYRFLNGIIF